MSHSLPKGTEIRCPRKRHLIGKLSRMLNAGEGLMLARVDFESGQKVNAGEPAACAICGSLYYVQHKLYTDDGWKPSDPNLEPVSRK